MFLSYKNMVATESMLDPFIKDAIKQGFSYSKIKKAALEADWPAEIFDEHFERIRQSGQRQDELRYGGGTKEGLEQHQAQQKKAWDIGTGKVRPDGSAYSK